MSRKSWFETNPLPGVNRIFGERRVGRTLRMLEEAKKLVDKGSEVCIVTANNEQSKRLADILCPSEKVHYLTIDSPAVVFSPNGLGVLGFHEVEVFFDHYALECAIENERRYRNRSKAIEDVCERRLVRGF